MNNMFTDYLDAQKKLMEEWKEMTQEATKNQWGSMEEFKDLWKWWDQPNFKAFADYTGSPKEVCILGMTPTTSTTVMTVIGDILVVQTMQKTGFTIEDYSKRHHGGYLGEKSRALCVK